MHYDHINFIYSILWNFPSKVYLFLPADADQTLSDIFIAATFIFN